LWKMAFHNFRIFAWISTNFTHSSLLDYHSYIMLSQVLCKMSSKNAHGCTQNAENGFGYSRLFTAILQKWRHTSQPHRNGRWKVGFICEC
jgi:hypothetical protein